MKIITISGLDGSGKSTQAESLKNYLENKGKRVFYFHAGNFSIANKILGTKKDLSGKEISVSKAGWLKIFLRKIALHIDLGRFKLLRSKLRNSGYDYVLSDRYFYDTIINIIYLEESNKLRSYELQAPDIAIYLNTNPEAIMSRDRVPDQGLAYLKKKKELYDQYAEIFGMKVIDGNRSKEEIFEEMLNLIH